MKNIQPQGSLNELLELTAVRNPQFLTAQFPAPGGCKLSSGRRHSVHKGSYPSSPPDVLRRKTFVTSAFLCSLRYAFNLPDCSGKERDPFAVGY
jgi:hypothetical protein